MPVPTTFRGRMTQTRRLQGAVRVYRGSSDYAARRTGAILQRGLTSTGTTTAPSSPSTGCNPVLAAAGVSCAAQASAQRLGLPPSAALIQRQRLAAGTAVSRHAGVPSSPSTGFPSFPSFPTPTSGYNPNAARSGAFTGNIGARLAAMRAQVQGYQRGGYPSTYAPTQPGTYTAGGYQTTGPDTTPAPAPPASAPEQAQPQLPAPQTAPAPAAAADPRQALQVFQQSRTARGLPTVSGTEYLPSVDALAQQLLMTNDPDSRGALSYTLGHVYQVISEQAVRLGDLGLAQVYASLAARYPAPPAMAGFGAVQLGGVSLGGWALALAVSLGAAVGLLAVRDARRPARSSRRNGRGRRR